MAGVTGAVSPSGQLNPGNLSISGQRESANSFLVNGSDVQERMNGGTSIVPNLDSIDQFRVLTSNFDPAVRQLQRRHRQRRSRSRAATRSTAARSSSSATRRSTRGTTFRRSAPSSSRSSPAARSAARSRRAGCSSSATIRARARRRASRPGRFRCRRCRARAAIFCDAAEYADRNRERLRTGRACCRSGSATPCRRASRTTRRLHDRPRSACFRTR